MAAVALLPLINNIAGRFSAKQQELALGKFKSTFGERYDIAQNLLELLQLLAKDNRISATDTFVLENLGPFVDQDEGPPDVADLIDDFNNTYKDEIDRLKEQESLIIRRQELIDEVDSFMRNGHGVLLFGGAGTGKTFLAKQYLSETQFKTIKQIDLRDIKEIKVVIVEILRTFGQVISTETVDVNVLGARLKQVKEQSILFLDNADEFFSKEKEIPLKDTGLSNVIEKIIESGDGQIKLLITSRNKSSNVEVSRLLRQQKVGQLDGYLARKLLGKFKMSSKPSEEMLTKAIEICKLLPLNLTLLGGMLQDAGSTVDGITRLVEKYANEELQLIYKQKERDAEREIEIYTDGFLETNFNNVSDTIRIGAVALSLFCRPFTAEDVEFMFEEKIKISKLKLILHALKHSSLLSEKVGRYDFHPKVRSYLQSKKDDSTIKDFFQGARTKFLHRYKSKFQDIAQLLHRSYNDARNLFQDEYANFEFAFDQHVTVGIPLFDNYHDLQVASALLGGMFKKEWRVNFFKKLAESTVAAGYPVLGSLYLCKSAHARAALNAHKGLEDLDQADRYLLKSRDEFKGTAEEKNELDAVTSMYQEARGNCFYEIAKNSRKMNDKTEALQAYQRTCDIRAAVYGNKDAYGLASSYSGLGACLDLIAQDVRNKKEKKVYLKQALENYVKALKMHESVAKISVDVPIILQNMAAAYQESGQYKKAVEYYKKAFEAEKTMKTDGFYTTAKIKFNLANTYRDLNKSKEALTMAKEALQIRESLYGRHATTVRSLYQIAVILHELRKYIEAITWYKKAFEMEESLPFNQHSQDRHSIREFMMAAYEVVIKKKLTYLKEEMQEMKSKFTEADEKEEREKLAALAKETADTSIQKRHSNSLEDEVITKMRESSPKLCYSPCLHAKPEIYDCVPIPSMIWRTDSYDLKKRKRMHMKQLARAGLSGTVIEWQGSSTNIADEEPVRQTTELFKDVSIDYNEEERDANERMFTDPGMARMFMDSDGGRFEFRYLGVVLDVPEDAIDSTELQLSLVPISNVKMNLGLGEKILSDVILVGPEECSFSQPVSLSIPHSLCEVPELCEIFMRFYDEEVNCWIDIPTEAQGRDAEMDDKLVKHAVAKIERTAMYVVCLLLKTEQINIPKSGLMVTPFGEEHGVKVTFPSGVFDEEDVPCDFKINKFTKTALHKLNQHSITTSPVLHISLAKQVTLKKPVKIELILQGETSHEGNIVILGGNEEILEDTAITSRYEFDGRSVTFQVDHFSIFVAVRTMYSNVKKYINTYVYQREAVLFQVYTDKKYRYDNLNRTCFVACSCVHDEAKMENECSNEDNKMIAQSRYEEGLYDWTKMVVEARGAYTIFTEVPPITLFFKSGKWCASQTFKLIDKQIDNAESQTEQQRVQQECASTVHNSFMISGKEDGEKYLGIPFAEFVSESPKTVADCKTTTSDSSFHDADEDEVEDHRPYRFFGLKLESCGFRDVFLDRQEDCSLFENVLPSASFQGVQGLAKRNENISSVKCALEKTTECFHSERLQGNWPDSWPKSWLENHPEEWLKNCVEHCFMKLHGVNKKGLSEVMEYLRKPCKNLIRTKKEYSAFLKKIHTRENLFKHKDVREVFGKKLGLKPADLENIERECNETYNTKTNISKGCHHCKLMVDGAYSGDYTKCQLDIVKALLRTQWHFKGESKHYKKRHNRIQKLLDELGSFIEETLEIVADDW